MIWLVGMAVAASVTVGLGGSTVADASVDFEQYSEGTVLTTQYAGLGGAGRGVVFGPLPAGAGNGLRPVVRVPPVGQAQSGSHVADIVSCLGCEFVTPVATGTFAIPRASVSVYVGYLGDPAICPPATVDPNAVGCAVVRLRAFDVNGAVLGESSARVRRGAGIHSLLSVSTASASIVGFEISGRSGTDASKRIAIDDLSFGNSAPGAPDFTLSPSRTGLDLGQGEAATVPITVGRLNGSTGDVELRADGLPSGVTATFSPNPAPGIQSVLTLTADSSATPAVKQVTVRGTPVSAGVGPAARSFTLSITVRTACPHVGTARELVDRVKAGFKCIYVNDDAKIDLAAVPDNDVSDGSSIIVVPDGVTLMSGRSPTRLGGMLEMSHRIGKTVMLALGSNTRVTGLRLRGYDPTDHKDRDDGTRAIRISGSSGVLVDNNEIFGWPRAAVDVTDTPNARHLTPRITRNFIHNNVQCSVGYGIVVAGHGFARIDHNLFNYNRHDVAGHGSPGDGYIAELNFSLTSGPTCNGDYNQHYDMHGLGGNGGPAGTFMMIRRNTIRGAQEYNYGFVERSAFWLRGTPSQRAYFEENAVHNRDSLGRHGAVRVKGVLPDVLLAGRKLVVRHNRLCVDTAAELAVGDFNGDGRDDVFQSVGTLWVYSPSGAREWHVLNDSALRLDRLGLGDFDGDGKTDVFFQDGGRWLVSSGGTSPSTPLPVGSAIPVKSYRFYDFDGDRKTDVFRASGSQFFYSSAGATAWRPLARSRLAIGDLRFGDFDGDGKTDVFSLTNGQWSVSDGGSGGWRRLNARLSSNLGSLVFADFNGDRHTDIARTSGGNWQVSWGGATPWKTLQFRRHENLSVGMLFGDFNGDSRDDVLQHGVRGVQLGCWAARSHTLAFRSFNYFKLSAGAANPFIDRWSSADMR